MPEVALTYIYMSAIEAMQAMHCRQVTQGSHIVVLGTRVLKMTCHTSPDVDGKVERNANGEVLVSD